MRGSHMRLDKFLQMAGLIKRRVLACEACKRGLVKVNGISAKPTREILPGDEVVVSLPFREVAVKILKELPDHPFRKDQRPELFEVLRDVAKAPPGDDPWESW